MSMPKNSPNKVPGKAIATSGGKTGPLQTMKVTSEMPGGHEGVMSGHSEGSWPNSPTHAGPNLESAVVKTPNDSNMSAGLGPNDVPGKGL
jgi:hypothetical protein